MSKLESDLWKQLVAEAGAEEDDAITRAASLAVKEAEAELTAAGFDVPAERAKAAAFLEALENGTLDAEPEASLPDPPPSAATAVAQDPTPHVSTYPQPHRRRDRPVVLWVAIAATIVVAAGALYAALGQPPMPGPAPTPPLPSPSAPAPVPSAFPDLVAAADLRHQAAAACDAQQWSVCLAQLDQARAADPDGDEAGAVTALRKRAIAGILQKPKPPVP